MAAESKARVLTTAAVVCFVCSVMVSVVAVALKPIQHEARVIDQKRNILDVLGLYVPGEDINTAFSRLQPRLVELDSGEFSDAMDVTSYNMFAAAKNPATGTPIPDELDIASINFRPRYATVYLKRDASGAVQQVVLPVQGYGLWSTMYAFVAVAGDGNTVSGVKFYQHAETPGLGGEVSNPEWTARWVGKKIYGNDGEVALQLVKGGVASDNPGAVHQVDALSGATLTSNGVSALIAYWLSDQAYRPFLSKLASGTLRLDPPVASVE